ncbi:MAG: hypothetical protein NVS1B4_04000 [Gemmatimonadaceae bacterium]
MLGLAMSGCTDVGTDPSAPASIRFEALASPSVVEGDVLRDSLGIAASLRATAFNSQNAAIPSSPIRFQAVDTGVVAVDSISGGVRAIRRDTLFRAQRVVARVGTLQALPRTVIVVPRPDTVRRISPAIDTLRYLALDDASNVSSPLQVRVLHIPAATMPADTVVRSWIVRYRFASRPPAATDTTLYFVKGGTATPTDTTDANGTAGLQIRVKPSALTRSGRDARGAFADSAVAYAFVTYRQRVPVSGGGDSVRFVVHIRLR